MRVFVYWNLHKDCYSIMALEGPRNGRVIGYSASVHLGNAEFKVGNAARERIARGGKKEVHAGIRGQLISTSAMPVNGLTAITYNPRLHTSFILRSNLNAIHTSSRVVCLTGINGRADCYAQI